MRPQYSDKREQGAIAVIIAVMLIGLLAFAAFVIDIGALYEKRSQVQTAVDGASLAGAQLLPDQSAASAKAIEYLARNNVSSASSASISFPDPMKIKVTAPDQTVEFALAPVFGTSSSTTKATATAIKEYKYHFVPWALVLSSLTPAQQSGSSIVYLKVGSGMSIQGNFQSVDIPRGDESGTSSRYERNIENGTESPVAVGDVFETLTGNRVGPLTDGLFNDDPLGLLRQGSDPHKTSYRAPSMGTFNIDACTKADVISGSTLLEPGCPRIVSVPVIADWPNGTKPVQVIDILWFFISEPPPPTSGQVSEVKGYVIQSNPSLWPFTVHLIE